MPGNKFEHHEIAPNTDLRSGKYADDAGMAKTNAAALDGVTEFASTRRPTKEELEEQYAAERKTIRQRLLGD